MKGEGMSKQTTDDKASGWGQTQRSWMKPPPKVTIVPQRGGRTLWQLEEDYFYEWHYLGAHYRFGIPAGFKFDGSSVPRLLRIIADRNRFGVLAPLVHDWLIKQNGIVNVDVYKSVDCVVGWHFLSRREFSRRDADRLFFRILRDQGVKPRWLRRWAFRLVRLWSLLNGDRYQ